VRSAVDRFADGREKDVACSREVAWENDLWWIESIGQFRECAPDQASAPGEELGAERITALGRNSDVVDGNFAGYGEQWTPSFLGAVGSDSNDHFSTRDGFEAAGVPTAADDMAFFTDDEMADHSGGAAGADVKPAVGD
jgi:hypothetical protein